MYLCICMYLYVSLKIHTRCKPDTYRKSSAYYWYNSARYIQIKQCKEDTVSVSISMYLFVMYLSHICVCICMYLYVSLRCAHAIRQQFTHLFLPICRRHAAASGAFQWSNHEQVASMRAAAAGKAQRQVASVEEDLNQGTETLQTVFQIQTNMKYMQYIWNTNRY